MLRSLLKGHRSDSEVTSNQHSKTRQMSNEHGLSVRQIMTFLSDLEKTELLK